MNTLELLSFNLGPMEEITWMAGFFDGEGSIGLGLDINGKYKSYGLCIQLGNTNSIAVQIYQEFFGGEICIYEPPNPRWSTVYHWICPANAHENFLDTLGTFVVIKQPQFVLARQFLRTKEIREWPDKRRVPVEILAERERIYQEFKKYNGHKGCGRKPK